MKLFSNLLATSFERVHSPCMTYTKYPAGQKRKNSKGVFEYVGTQQELILVLPIGGKPGYELATTVSAWESWELA